MTKAEDYRARLRQLDDWDVYLLQESGLPGPRGNLELAQVVADEGDRELFMRYITFTADKAPVNSPMNSWLFAASLAWGACWPLATGGCWKPYAALPPIRVGAYTRQWRWRSSAGETQICSC